MNPGIPIFLLNESESFHDGLPADIAIFEDTINIYGKPFRNHYKCHQHLLYPFAERVNLSTK